MQRQTALKVAHLMGAIHVLENTERALAKQREKLEAKRLALMEEAEQEEDKRLALMEEGETGGWQNEVND